MSDEKRRHSVEDGEILQLSVSQLKTFSPEERGGCPRKWFFNKVMRLPIPQSAAQAAGTEGHKQLEHYLKTGQDVLGRVAREGKEFLPEPGPDLRVEVSLDELGGLTGAGIPFVGSIDLVNPRRLPVLNITDHKFTKDFKWAKPGEELGKDPQLIGYAVAASKAYPAATHVTMEHIVYKRVGAPEARRTRAVIDGATAVPVETVRRLWQSKFETLIEHEMKPAARETDPFKIPGNPDSCDAFGGCPFLDNCHDPLTRLFSMPSLRDTLFARPAQKPAAPPPVQAAAPTPPPAPALPKGVLAAQQAGIQVIQTALPDGTIRYDVPPTPAGIRPACLEGGLYVFGPNQMEALGVDCYGRPVAVAAKPAPVIEDNTSPGFGAATVPAAVGVLPPDAPASVAIPPPPPPAPEKPKRGRKPKETAVAAPGGGTVAASAPTAAPASEGAGASHAVATGPAPAPSGLYLYVDCHPSMRHGGELVDLGTYVQSIADECAEAAGITDVQLAPKDSPLAYGGWKGAMRGMARQNPPPPGRYVVRSGDLADPVIEALALTAVEVVRGLK